MFPSIRAFQLREQMFNHFYTTPTHAWKERESEARERDQILSLEPVPWMLGNLLNLSPRGIVSCVKWNSLFFIKIMSLPRSYFAVCRNLYYLFVSTFPEKLKTQISVENLTVQMDTGTCRESLSWQGRCKVKRLNTSTLPLSTVSSVSDFQA